LLRAIEQGTVTILTKKISKITKKQGYLQGEARNKLSLTAATNMQQ